MSKLTFASQNAKLVELSKSLGLTQKQVRTFDLPAGFTCPAADECKTFANKSTGKMTIGPNQKFQCYASRLEMRYPNVRQSHWNNFDLLRPIMKDTDAMVTLILDSIPDNVKVVRVHSSGDFFTLQYFEAWLKVAEIRSDIVFFGYTKILPYACADCPDNFHLVYSMGGIWDEHYKGMCVPSCTVVQSESEAESIGLPVACATPTMPGDYEYIIAGKSFAIVLH